MDCFSPLSPIERVVLMKGAQIGGTELGLNWIGDVIHAERGWAGAAEAVYATHTPAPSRAKAPERYGQAEAFESPLLPGLVIALTAVFAP